MAKCRYCGQKVGWLKQAHDERLRNAEQARLLMERERGRIEKAQQQVQLVQAQEALEERLNRRAREEEERLHRRTREEEERKLREYPDWRLRHAALVDRFLEIAERKVSLLDDYGDEHWDSLPKEIETLLLKTAKADNHDISPMRTLLFRGLQGEDFARAMRAKMRAKSEGEDVTDWVILLGKYTSLRSNLESEFRSYHESRKKQTTTPEFNNLSGIEFETYLGKLLLEHGFEDIRGTPATGDQGADLIAKRNGQTIVIQAKRYQGSVSNRAVQEVVGAINFYGADEGWVITSGTFTPSAKALAQKSKVKLIDGHALRMKQLA